MCWKFSCLLPALGDEQACKCSPSPRSESFRQTSCFHLWQGHRFHRWVECWMHNSSLRWQPKLCPRYCRSGTAPLNTASPIPRPFGPPEAAGCGHLRAVCKVAVCWHESQTGCSAPYSRPFINEGIRDEGNLL